MPPTTSTLSFFSSAAASFQPAPYTPVQSSSSRSGTRLHQRSHDSIAIPPGMDPLPSDPNVLFIHFPFTVFPNSHLHPDGLTYSLMADNPSWFLVAQDFITQPSGNSSAIPYPPHLEPPRGWCPAKKKDLKDRGTEGWPEGEEPRLRCTFCRRTYAGVNAKSMWRRHVFEKHKIAMSNRRDGNTDRPRGRGSGKENRHHSATRVREATHDSLVSMIVTPQTAPDNVSHKSRFRPGKQEEVPKRRRDREHKKDTEDKVSLPTRNEILDVYDQTDEDSENDLPPQANSPPPSPHVETSSDPAYALSGPSDEPVEVASVLPGPVIPESPYDPSKSPSFRHSPPPLPSDQPWRYPSPSHPLHSTTRDLSLTIVARSYLSPIKSAQSLGSSTMTMLGLHSSPLSNSMPFRSSVNGFETPARPNFLFPKSINRPYFQAGLIPSPLSSVKKYRSNRQTFETSPIRKSSTLARKHVRQSSDVSDTWFSEGPLTSPSSTPLASTSNDPFSICESWPAVVGDSRISSVHLKVPAEPDSPVLRNGSLPSSNGLGIGLLEPFSFPRDDFLNPSVDTEIGLSPLGKPRTEAKRTAILEECDSPTVITPPSKKRRMSPETTDT